MSDAIHQHTLSIQIDPMDGERQRLTLAGRLDTHTHDELDAVLEPLLATGITTLILDLAGLEYISSAGLRSIFKARKVLGQRDGKVLAVNLQPQVRKVFEVVKAVPMGSIFVSRHELDAYLDTLQLQIAAQKP